VSNDNVYGDARSQTKCEVDLVTLEIIQSALIAACKETSEAMMQTAYSPIFSEGKDFSIALFDVNGEMFAQGTGCPSQLGAMPMLVEWCIHDMGLENIEPGDVIMHNDAYRGGTHLPEFTMVRPLHVQDRLVGFAANIAHHVDIGGKSAGGFPGDATDVFMEGFRLPAVKLYKRGVPNRDVWRFYLQNTRLPRNAFGDLHAMYGSLILAQKRVSEVVERYGFNTYFTALDEIKDYSERRMREEIRQIPDGVYRGVEVMEDDGVSDLGPFEIRVTVVVNGDEMIVDYSDSAIQARGPINCPLGVTASGTYNGLLQLTDPSIPTNSGCFRPVRIITRPGTIMNVDFPGACYGGNTETHNRIVDVMHDALVHAIPHRVSAPTGSTCCNLTYGGLNESGEYYANYQWDGVGWGAGQGRDGNSAIVAPGGNSRIQSIEVIENRFPWIVESYGLRPDSGGPGEFRGGLGTVRVMTAKAPMQINGLSDRFVVPAQGLAEGASAATGAFLIRRKGCSEWKTVPEDSGAKSLSKFADVPLSEGDSIMFCTPGGGGFGPPSQRDPTALEHDILNGYVTMKAAESVYSSSRTKNK
jgi:N-methylhydantoinase B